MKRLLATLPSFLLLVAPTGCVSDMGLAPSAGPGPNPGPGGDPYWCCDPDEPYCVCPSYWVCTEGSGRKSCSQDNPSLPDDVGAGSWICEYRDELVVCTGTESDHPEAGQDGEWDCTSANAQITCSHRTTEDDYPSDEGGGPWECSFGAGSDLRVCDDAGADAPDYAGWDCSIADDGNTVCVNDSAETPDDGSWSCVQDHGSDVCTGDHLPSGDGGSAWECTEDGEMIRCENPNGQSPGDGSGNGWDCFWTGELEITCTGQPGGDDTPPDETPPPDGTPPPDDTTPPDETPPPDDGGDDCGCPPDAWRYCDTPTYCSWGIQECVEVFGMAEWGPCQETDRIPGACYTGGWYDPEAEGCAIDQGYCAQDFWDLNGNGDNQETLGENCPNFELLCF